MESLELRIFLKVAQFSSITQAAKELGYVQSNVTAHIKKLENELGTCLFNRHNKGVALTRDGEKLLGYARQVVDLLDDVPREVQPDRNTLRIGTTQTIAGSLLPPCLLEYQKTYPQAEITVSAEEQGLLEKKLEKGRLDCVLTNSTHDFSSARRVWTAGQKIAIAAPLSCLSLEDTWELPVLVNTIKSCPYRELLMNWRSERKGTGKVMELDTVEAMLHMVALGGGITLPPVGILKGKKVRQFDIPELQVISISMWVLENCSGERYAPLKRILEKELKNM